MKLTIDFNGDEKGFNLLSTLDMEIERDAESLGYITNVLFEMAQRLAEFAQTANPKYTDRISDGVRKASNEKLAENSDTYPFTTTIIKH